MVLNIKFQRINIGTLPDDPDIEICLKIIFYLNPLMKKHSDTGLCYDFTDQLEW